MSTVTTLPTRHTYTADDLASMPDDGNRYELIDGTLIVTPAPAYRHQHVASELAFALRSACPDGLQLLFAPFDVRMADDTVTQPDLLVIRNDGLDADEKFVGVPLLAVEILSPSTRLVDLNLKKARYELAGCPSYWCVDPGSPDAEPWVTVWELTDGQYVEAGHAEGDCVLHVERPYPLDITPAALARR